jgi:hypothetical protein
LIEIKVSFKVVWSLTSSATILAATTSSWRILLLFISLVNRWNINFDNFFLFLGRLFSLPRLCLTTFLSIFFGKFFNFLQIWLFRSRLGDFLPNFLRLLIVTSLSAPPIARFWFRFNLNPIFFLGFLYLSLRFLLLLLRSALALLRLSSSRSNLFRLFLTFNLGTFALASSSRFLLLS